MRSLAGPPADLAVIIVSYGSAHLIPACLSTLYGAAESDGLSLDVVIADNDPRTPVAPLIATSFPQVRVLSCENRGFGHGNNVAYAATAAPHVLFLNPDTEIRGGSLAAILARFAEDPRIGLLGCRQLDPEGELTPTIRRFPGVGRALADALGAERLLGVRSPGQRELHPAAYTAETRCDWTSGSFMLARRAALDSLGDGPPFDERFFLFSEEVDLCRRLVSAGWSIRHSPTLEILHYTRRAGVDGRLAAQEAFARRQYAEKHFSPGRRALFLAVTGVGYALRTRGARGPRRRPGARGEAAARALRTLSGIDPPPFAEPR
jgi:N-acetylglucosaminyl-diphospho-decaprenol L-rhamnosyltransferase